MKQELYVKYLEDINPINRLIHLYAGRQPSVKTIVLISKIQNETKLSNGVINVLLEYVFLYSSQNKDKNVPPNELLERLAKKCVENNVKTAKEAMAFVREEYDKEMFLNNKNKANEDADAKKEDDRNEKATIAAAKVKEEQINVESEQINSIRLAIQNGLSDKDLGKFVRTMLGNGRGVQ